MRSYRPQELFDKTGRLVPELAELAPKGERRMSANPHANGGLLLRDLRLPDFRDYAVTVPRPGAVDARGHARAGRIHPRRHHTQRRQLPRVQPGRNDLESLERRVRGDEPVFDRGDPSRRRSRRARWPRDGNAERAPMRRLARRLSAHRPPRVLLLLRGVHSHRRFDVQPARQVAEGGEPDSVAPADRLAELPADVACLAAGPQRLQPSGSRLHRSWSRTRRPKSSASICRPMRTRCSR